MNEQKIVKRQLIKNMLLNLITFTIIFGILGLFIYTNVKSSIYKSADEELLNSKNRVAIRHDFEREKNIEEKLDDRPKRDEEVNPRLIYIRRNIDGNILEEDRINTIFKDINFDSKIIDKIYNMTIENRYMYRGINYKLDNDTYIQLLINIDAENNIISNFKNILIASIIITILISIIASYILSKKTLKPIVESWKKENEFVQNASHELRTPLTIIKAKQELLLDEPNSKIIDKAEEINTSLNETRRLEKLIKELMILAKSDANKQPIVTDMEDIDELIKEFCIPFQEFALVQEKEFILDLRYNKKIKINKERIHELFIILLDNSMKYTEKNDTIKISTYEKEGRLYIEIIDSGIGVSDEGLTKIFDRFYREDKARSRETGGSGLGLSIAETIVKEHKGIIKALHGENGQGTKIQISIGHR